jgi:hypothetical protein
MRDLFLEASAPPLSRRLELSAVVLPWGIGSKELAR